MQSNSHFLMVLSPMGGLAVDCRFPGETSKTWRQLRLVVLCSPGEVIGYCPVPSASDAQKSLALGDLDEAAAGETLVKQL